MCSHVFVVRSFYWTSVLLERTINALSILIFVSSMRPLKEIDREYCTTHMSWAFWLVMKARQVLKYWRQFYTRLFLLRNRQFCFLVVPIFLQIALVIGRISLSKVDESSSSLQVSFSVLHKALRGTELHQCIFGFVFIFELFQLAHKLSQKRISLCDSPI